jgi:uncharacterized membrane protein
MFHNFGASVGQHGPPEGMFGQWMIYLWIPVVIVLAIIVIVLFVYLPRVRRVKGTEPEQVVEQPTTQRLEEPTEEPVAQNLEQKVEQSLTSQATEDKVSEVKSDSISDRARTEAALTVLEEDERKVVNALMDAGGQLLQKEISWKTGFSRVKTHRLLVKLLRRGVVSTEKYYNTNRITLTDWLLKGKPEEGSENKTSEA